VHEQFGTYGAWLNSALGDAPVSNTPTHYDVEWQGSLFLGSVLLVN